MSGSKIVTVLIRLVAGVVVLGQTHAVGQQTPQEIAVSRHFKLLGLTLGKNTFADVQIKLGGAQRRRCSGAEEGIDQLCYLSSDQRAKIVFLSGFPGGWSNLDGFKIIAADSQEPCYTQCPRASLNSNSIQTAGGLRLGLNPEQVHRLLGSPRKIEGDTLIFQWEAKQPWTKDDFDKDQRVPKTAAADAFWDVLDTISVTFKGSKVVQVGVYHTVTF
jgi:hypothetical protein